MVSIEKSKELEKEATEIAIELCEVFKSEYGECSPLLVRSIVNRTLVILENKKTLEEKEAVAFVRHIKRHLKPDEKVICTICGKDIKTIMEEDLT